MRDFKFLLPCKKPLVWEGLVKSFLISLLSIGILVCLLAVINYFIALVSWWVILGLGAALLLMLTTCLYLTKYKPSIRNCAFRVDALGLQERMITALDYQNSEDNITELQYNDAVAHTAKVTPSQIKIRFSKILVLVSALIFLLSASSVTLNALAEEDIIKGGKDLIEDTTRIFYDVEYVVDDDLHGYIEGDFIQRVEKGDNCIGVLAVAEDGYVFKKWNDGVTDPYRQDLNILGNAFYQAIFELLEESRDSEPDADSDQDSSKIDDSALDKSGSGGSNTNTGGNGGSVKWNPNNQILDNKTYYGDIYDDAKRAGLDKVSQNDSISKTSKDLVSNYYKGTEPKGNKEN